MKFHHLTRQNQYINAAHKRDLSPIKRELQHQQQHQATSLHNHQDRHQLNNNNNISLTDDEDDEFNDVNYYDAILAAEQQHQQQSQMQTNGGGRAATSSVDTSNHQSANQQNAALDSTGFLMDKNKKLFPQKLWELIHNPNIQHCLRWSQDGQRVYLNRNEFETYYLKTPNNQFHTQKAISFVRQMNMYGFRKVDDCYYENDNFRRDQQYLLKNMIRRHPNKGLFVGLDHHQLAAAAAAQQALQVNQQLQQLEHQHKHRAEQALRLNSYLNSHQFHQHHNHNPHHPQHHHSTTTFEQMSNQLAQAAANHLSQQQFVQHRFGITEANNNNNNSLRLDNSNSFNQAAAAGCNVQTFEAQEQANKISQLGGRSLQVSPATTTPTTTTKTAATNQQHQPKKSRLLNNFYASSNENNNNNNNNGLGANNLATTFASQHHHHLQQQLIANGQAANQIILSQDSMHSTSSVDTQPSQCSSAVNSGSAGSPQPNSPKNLLHQQNSLGKLARNKESSNESRYLGAAILNNGQTQSSIGGGGGGGGEGGATDMTNQSLMAAQQAALHQTLVRSLLQLKQQSHQPGSQADLLACLQHQHNSSRSLLESLASLSSGGTGSIIDPTSNSPTEQSATPPSSGVPSPAFEVEDLMMKCNNQQPDGVDFDTVLDLASKPSSKNSSRHHVGESLVKDGSNKFQASPAGATNIEDEEAKTGVVRVDDSPMDGAKKVEKFLQDHIRNGSQTDGPTKRKSIDIDRESPAEDHDARKASLHAATKKRVKLEAISDDEDPSSSDGAGQLARSLIVATCHRRGDQLSLAALDEAAGYLECFLDVLLDDASLIAGHSTSTSVAAAAAAAADEISKDDDDTGAELDGGARCRVIDASNLSLALKLIPAKLIGAIQQYLAAKTTTSQVGGPTNCAPDCATKLE